MGLLFEDFEVQILIVAKNPARLKNACEYLKAHGWPAVAVSELPKAVEYIKQARPHIVLLSFNHPSPALSKLPDVLEQSKEMICVAFVENGDPQSVDTLTAVKVRHKIFGDPSGANFHRGVSRILAAMYQPAEEPPKVPAPKPVSREQVKAQLRKAAQEALQAVGRNSQGVAPSPLPPVRRLGVIPFESNEMPGYLVMAKEDRGDEDRAVLDQCGKMMQAAYAGGRLPGALKSAFWLECPEVQFQKWAARGVFQVKGSHRDRELGVAFFQSEQPLPQVRVANEDEMCAVSLERISTAHPLPCSLFLYLKTNRKYFLYLRDGRQLQPAQKERLLYGKVREIYVRKSDMEALNRFWATLTLAGTFASL